METFTDLPGMQLYTDNGNEHRAFCLETQFYPLRSITRNSRSMGGTGPSAENDHDLPFFGTVIPI